MALTRVTNFTAGVLPFDDLNSEFNNVVNYINNRVLSNPLTSNIDFADLYTVANLRSFWNILNVAEYASLSAAEAALPSTGGVLFIPPQTTIDVTSTVTLSKDNTWVIGGGPSSILRRGSGTFTPTNSGFLVMNGRKNCAVLNLQIDGQQLGNATAFSAIRVLGACEWILIGQILTRRWGGSGDVLTDPNHGIFIGDSLASPPRRVRVIDCDLADIRSSGVHVQSGRDILVRHNSMRWAAINANYGIRVLDTAGSEVLQEIAILDNEVGNVDLTSLRPETGIAVGSTATSVTASFSGFSIAGNRVSNTQGSGISLSNLSNGEVRNNRVYRACVIDSINQAGIRVLDCQYSQIKDNQIFELGEDLSVGGISIQDANGIHVGSAAGVSVQFVQVKGNMIYRTASDGIILKSGGVTLHDVDIDGNHVSQFGRKSTSTNSGINLNQVSGQMNNLSCSRNRVTRDGSPPAGTNANGITLPIGSSTSVRCIGNDVSGSAAGTGLGIANKSAPITDLELAHNLGE